MTKLIGEDAARLAVYQLLKDNVQLSNPYVPGNPDNRTVPVVDDATGALPYVALGAGWEVPDNDLSAPGALVVITVHTWSSYNGFAEVTALNRRVAALLDRPAVLPAALAEYDPKHTSVTVTSVRSMRDEDTRYRHGVIDVTVRLQQLVED